MDSMIAKLRVALQLDSAAFESGADRAAQQVNALGINMDAARARMNSFSEGLIVSGNTAQRMGSQMRAVNDNAGLMRAGLQNLGFQLQDITVQFASGQRASTIFAQQLPQVAGAMTQIVGATGATSGVLGRLAAFMSGPWGVAVGVGAAVLPTLIGMLYKTGAAATDAAVKMATFGDILAKLRTKPMEALGDQQTKVFKAQQALNAAMALPVGGGSAAYVANTYAGKKRADAIAQAQLDLQNARSELETLQATAKSNEFLFQIVNNAGKLSAKNLSADKAGGSPARRAGQEAAREYRSGLEDELRKLEQTTKGLEDSVFKPLADRTKEGFARRDSNAQKWLLDQLSDVSKVTGYTGEKITDTNKKIGESFFDMSQRAISSLQQLSNGIRSGDFLSTLSGVLNVLKDLAGFGLFGSKIKASVLSIDGAKADGGPVNAGRMYMVGERGPELFRPNASGTIVPNHALRGVGPGGNVINNYYTLPSDEFWGRINAGHAVAAQAGGEIGYNKVRRAGARSLAG